jgi:3-methyladenine DNA glycosylase AlkD
MTVSAILSDLRRAGSRKNVEGMARYGIHPARAFGVPSPVLDAMARRLGRDHALAARLWKTGVHEARMLAALVDEPSRVTPAQMERWAKQFDSWALCDTVCGKLFDRTPYAYEKARAWSSRREEYVKRAGFALMAWLAVHDKPAEDDRFVALLPLIEREASDPRNFVRKAVNWALRQIGKRNARLLTSARASARRIARQGTPSARWIAADALREWQARELSRASSGASRAGRTRRRAP